MDVNIKRGRLYSGFTLIEIIIVVVILGILASIALHKVTANIDKVRAAEAFNMGGAIAKAFDRCLADETAGKAIKAADVANCTTFTNLKVEDPSPGSLSFTYILSLSNPLELEMDAEGKAALGLNPAVDTITFYFDAVTGSVSKDCGGATSKFFKMCKN